MGEIYVGDIVRLSEEYGGLLGTLVKVDSDNHVDPALVRLSAVATVTVPPEALTYAGPPIPPEPEVGAMVLVADVPYRRDDKGWHRMGRATSPVDELMGLFFETPSAYAWSRVIRRQGHATPQRLVAVDLDAS